MRCNHASSFTIWRRVSDVYDRNNFEYRELSGDIEYRKQDANLWHRTLSLLQQPVSPLRWQTEYCRNNVLVCVSANQCEVNIGHISKSWWRHQMGTFSALLAICAGNSPAPGEFPTQRPVTRSFDVFFDLRLNKRLSKQSWGWWFETPSRTLWRQCNYMHVSLRWAQCIFSVGIIKVISR